jgi:hypothetical protein
LDAANLRKSTPATYGIGWGIPLSSMLISFDAEPKDNNNVDLSWITVNEINLHHFVVERSIDGVNFSDVGEVAAKGNTTDKTNYGLIDNISQLQSSLIYYRLRTVSMDGKNQYSDIRIIRLNKQLQEKLSIIVYPNPVKDQLRIVIPQQWQHKQVTYELYSNDGQLVKQSVNVNSGQTEILNLRNLSRGSYLIKVVYENQSIQQKIVKQ